MDLVRRSRTLIDSFDLLKCHSDAISNLLEQSEKTHSKHLKKRLINLLRSNVLQNKQKRRNQALACHANKRRLDKFQRRILGKMRQVLHLEKMWLREVRY